MPAAAVRERHLAVPSHRPTMAGVPLLVDASHGPDDPGFVSPDGVPEHEVTWAIANRLHGRLAALGARPVLARGPGTTPTRVAPRRPGQPRGRRGDPVRALQRPARLDRRPRGVSATYFGHEGSISERGRRLATEAVERICDATGTPNCRAHPSTSALLRESRAVAVAVEVGFLTHPEEGRLLTDPEYQGIVAGCLSDALADWMLG